MRYVSTRAGLVYISVSSGILSRSLRSGGLLVARDRDSDPGQNIRGVLGECSCGPEEKLHD